MWKSELAGGAKVLAQFGHRPFGEAHFPPFPQGGGILVGLEFGVVVGELVEEDGDGQTVQDDAEGDADEGEEATQHRLRVDVSVAHRGDADLQGETNATSRSGKTLRAFKVE